MLIRFVTRPLVATHSPRQSAPLLVDAETCVMLNTATRMYFYLLEALNRE